MLFVAETYIHYVSEPTDYEASEAFSFALMSTDNSSVYCSVSIPDYENKVIGIYQTATQVTTLGLSTNTAYNLRITGNPTIFGTLIEGTNMVTRPLLSDYWIDQSVATSTSNPLRNFIILIAEDLEANDSPSTSYITTVQGIDYLSNAGGNIFLKGIPNLRLFCPSAFATAVTLMKATAPPTTGALQGELTILDKLGTNTSGAFTNLGNFLGIPARTAGTLALLIAVLVFAFYVYQRTGLSASMLLVGVMFAVFGMYLGLISLAVGFIAVMAVVVASVYFYMSKGTLS